MRAAVHIVEAHEQLDDGGLARAGGADDGNTLAVFDMGGKVMDDGLFRCVAKVHMLKGHIAFDAAFGQGAFAGVRLFFGF